MQDRLVSNQRCRILGEMLFMQIFFCYIGVYLCYISASRLSALVFPLALLCSYGYSCLCTRDVKASLKSLICSIAWWLILLPLSTVIIDSSYDGNAYHQEIIAALCRGWNIEGSQIPGIPLSVWAIHYAKGLEMVQASVVAFTGFIESGKAVNLIFGLSAGLCLYSFTATFGGSIKRGYRLLISLVGVCNPVFLSQCLTYYIDYSKLFLTLLAIIYIIRCVAESRRFSFSNFSFLFVVVVMGVVTKFNAFFEIGVTVFASMIWVFFTGKTKDAWRLAICGIAGAVTGVLILGYHPYITNYLVAGNPLYPLLGEGSIDIMTGNTPPEYLSRNRFVTFFLSLITPQLPSTDQRIGGFGVLMLPILVISLLAIFFSKSRWKNVGIYIAVWVLASCFFFEQSWWARYIPQLWIIVVEGCLFLALSIKNNKLAKAGFYVTAVSVLATALLCEAMAFKAGLRETAYRHAVVKEFQGREMRVYGLNEAYMRQMAERGLYTVPSDLDTVNYQLVPYFGHIAEPEDYPMIMADSVTKQNFLDRLNKLPFNYSQKFE